MMLGVSHTGEHGDLVNVVELSVALAVKGCPEVCNEDLRPLQESHFLSLKSAFVSKRWEFLCHQVDQSGS
jgi:hypothetical protein